MDWLYHLPIVFAVILAVIYMFQGFAWPLWFVALVSWSYTMLLIEFTKQRLMFKTVGVLDVLKLISLWAGWFCIAGCAIIYVNKRLDNYIDRCMTRLLDFVFRHETSTYVVKAHIEHTISASEAISCLLIAMPLGGMLYALISGVFWMIKHKFTTKDRIQRFIIGAAIGFCLTTGYMMKLTQLPWSWEAIVFLTVLSAVLPCTCYLFQLTPVKLS